MSQGLTQDLFRFDWSRFDAKLGLYHMLGCVVFLNLAEQLGASWLAAGVGALLTWITALLGQPHSHRAELGGMAAYLVLAIPLGYLAEWVAPYSWLGLASMFVIAFSGSLLIARSGHWFMVAWCLIYWYMLSPLFVSAMGANETLNGHLIGSGAVLLMNAIKRLWWRPPQPGEAGGGLLTLKQAIAYSSVVAGTMVIGLGAGAKFLKSDPTLISNAAFNILSPSARQTWRTGLLRMIFGTTGIVAGFYLGVFFPEPWAGQLVVAISSFVAVAMIRVDFAPLVGALFVMISYPWGTMDGREGHAIANERILAELAGVLLAGVAISVMGWLASRKSPESTAPAPGD